MVAEIGEAGGKAIANGADISDFAAAEKLVESTIEEFGRLDILVNVAGILRDRMIFNMTEQEWDDVIRVHLKGTFNTTKFASAHWRSLRDSSAQNRIVNFTSVSGLHGAPGQPNYAAAKMGIVGLTYSCAHSLAKYGVTVNAICPGAATRMTDSMPGERRRIIAPDAPPKATYVLGMDYLDWKALHEGYDAQRTVMYRKMMLEDGNLLEFFKGIYFFVECLAVIGAVPAAYPGR